MEKKRIRIRRKKERKREEIGYAPRGSLDCFLLSPLSLVRTWDEVVAMAMAGKSLGQSLLNPSKVLKLANLVTAEELVNEQEAVEIGEDIEEECKKYGQVVSYHIPRPSPTGNEVPGLGNVFVEFTSTEDAAKVSEE